jgi:hypothetical protein
MDTAKVANWLQIIGNFGIVVGLILVAVQINQNSEQIQQTANLSRIESYRQLFLNRVNNEQLRSTYEKLTAAGLATTSIPFIAKTMKEAELTEREAGMLYDEQHAWWSLYSHMIIDIDRLSAGQKALLDLVLRSAYDGTSWTANWYTSERHGLNPDAVRYSDNLLAQPG